jgi:Flp pilus assembly pilin Flp
MSNPTYRTHVTDQEGQTMAEYSVLVGLLVLTVALAVPTLGSAIGNLYSVVVRPFGA